MPQIKIDPPVHNQDHRVSIYFSQKKGKTPMDIALGSVVFYSQSGSNTSQFYPGIVVSHTKKQVVLIVSFNSHKITWGSNPGTRREYFETTSRDPNRCIPVGIEDIDDPEVFQELLDLYNHTTNSNIQLKFR
jgi:hypothetical protein